VLFHACQVSSNTVVVHRFPIRILVVTNPQLMLADGLAHSRVRLRFTPESPRLP
jgi:hypothetical protein